MNYKVELVGGPLDGQTMIVHRPTFKVCHPKMMADFSVESHPDTEISHVFTGQYVLVNKLSKIPGLVIMQWEGF